MPAALDPERHVMLINFTILSSLLHGMVMTYDAFAQPHEMMHLVGDVPMLFVLAAVLIWLHPRWQRDRLRVTQTLCKQRGLPWIRRQS